MQEIHTEIAPEAQATTLTAERLRELLHYDPDTGDFTWKVRGRGRRRGRPAGSFHRQSGYIRIVIDRKMYLAHRLVWLYQCGSFSDEMMDHINGVEGDNRFENLRPATYITNQQNRKIGVNNTSGVKGVDWSVIRQKWRVRIKYDGRQTVIGFFDDIEEAASAYALEAAIRFGKYALPSRRDSAI